MPASPTTPSTRRADVARWSRCRFCPRRLTDPESQRRGYGETCGRQRGLLPPKRRRTPIRTAPRPKPATVPAADDAIPGQTELELFHHQPTLHSI
ncbi:DUF6011 domain-containing protein [Streptomyces chartreusis]|uniref:DUF6011 domain-containing protein n=1 Tax=Streptomyces chartreusis TaxID=1969 RepID=UPI00365EC647